MKAKKVVSVLTGLALLFGFVGVQPTYAVSQFNQGAQYQQGLYDLNAQNPTSFGWQRVSRYNAVDSKPYVKWQFKTEISASTPAVSKDGTIYAASADKNFYAINPDGTLKWKDAHSSPIYYSSPVIGKDGTVYVGDYGRVYAYNPDGTIKWKTDLNTTFITPVIGADGTIYITGRNNYLYAFNPEGMTKWTFLMTNAADSAPAIGKDGTIYVAGRDRVLHAINPKGTEKWSFGLNSAYEGFGSPAIAKDGTIYIGVSDGNLYAINNDGSLKWKYKTGNKILSAPVVDDNGTIYFGSDDNYFYALHSDGTLKWKFLANGWVQSTAIIDNGGDILFATPSRVYCVDSDGDLKWYLNHLNDSLRSSLTIMNDGTILIGSNYNLTAISGTLDTADPGKIIDPCDSINRLDTLIDSGLTTQAEIDEANSILDSLKIKLNDYENKIKQVQQ